MTKQGQRYAEELKELMARQVERLEVFELHEESIQKEIQENNYDELKKSIQILSPLSDEIALLDVDRDRLFKLLKSESGEEESAGFYQVVVRLEPEIRDELSNLYRKLKIRIIRLQAITCGIEAYIRTVTATVHKILGDMYPHRKGKLYSKAGKEKESEFNPLLVNRKL